MNAERQVPAAAAGPTPRDRANALRLLAVDAVQAANSGHPGAPMGMADIAEVLWGRYLRHNPGNPQWVDRDRFVLSNGHGSMLLYALLHLTGYDLPIDELKRFRQLHSRTPGHPEFGETPGVETTTGPLGQGLANAVGMALAERLLAAEFNRGAHTIVDHHTYVFLGDGCLMEGISHEVASLAGTLRLGKLIAFYDDNGISIDGEVTGWFTDDTPRRFEAYGWHVVAEVDGHDPAAIERALRAARAATDRPSLIACRTVIGHGSPNKAGSEAVHGAPLGAAEVAATRENLGWTAPPFDVPAPIARAWDARETGRTLERDWRERFAAYEAQHPVLAEAFRRRTGLDGHALLPADWIGRANALLRGTANETAVATRKASQDALNLLAPLLPELLGGSADLTGSNLTNWTGCRAVGADGAGTYIHYGVREFGMAAMLNGIALHGGWLPFGGTFAVFSDYARNAIRMAALMRQRVVHVLTHDSIGLGEDGPTHQPIEHAASLRLIPGLDVWRPCDRVETLAAWISAVERVGHDSGPSALLLSRQNLPALVVDDALRLRVRRGGYVLRDAEDARAVIIATGSEVALAVEAAAQLAERGLPVRVVSLPCTQVFDRQPRAYRDTVLPPGLPRVAVEAGVTDYWRKYVGLDGAVVGIDRFGASAPAADLYRHLGLTAAAIGDAVADLLA
ncbi:transketolase [Dokdonella koreensis]|uniref:Transketolase n=1 Tax=Dokdonella koreensis DS-123 TaxID=1300342 RepID=A0A160DWC2_9GAMM|nr:transketolase [Dokdonella koreensis]ANB18501.1 Transketolase [Dokdonella koreensis DS-123]